MTKQELLAKNEQLRKAAEAYYSGNNPIMSDKAYDALYDEVEKASKELGLSLQSSPINNVGYEVVSNLPKDTHEFKALSLSKTKDRSELQSWLGDNIGCLSWKLDGLTLVLTYDGGNLVKAVTRGNGEVGEVVTHNAKYVKGIPQKIPFLNKMIVRGECLMTYTNFERVNSNLDATLQYKNPRNLTSGTIRSLDSKIVADRGLNFKAFELVALSNAGAYGLVGGSFADSLAWLKAQGFDVVDYVKVDKNTLIPMIAKFEQQLPKNDFPSDGLVVQYDDVVYGRSLGTTGKFPRSGKAFKWKDETAETTIRKIVWQAGRTGIINPVAEFDPVDLEGTTVRRATANNISFMKKLHLTVGSRITVYKANMIIPTIDENVNPVGELQIPQMCPSCGGMTQIRRTVEAEILYCANPNCPAKNLKHFTHFVSRDAMNVVGLAESTISMLMDNGFIQNYYDLYTLGNKPEVARLEGFGQGSYNNLIKALEDSKNVKLGNFIFAFGIDMVGKGAAKDIAKHVKYDVSNLVKALDSGYDFRQVEGIGDKTNQNLYDWWHNPGNRQLFIALAQIMNFEVPKVAQTTNVTTNASQSGGGANGIAGKVFCVTGSVYIFSNRNEVGDWIEARGGKLASSVTAKTDYLVTNDTTSGSAKNKKAQELGKPILTEQQLIDLGGGR